MASREQMEWEIVAAAIRADLALKAELLLRTCSVDDTKTFVTVASDAMFFELNACTYDEALESRQRSLERCGLYGDL